MEIKLHRKQNTVLDIIKKYHPDEILYGGAAGGGKSYLLRALAIILCMMIPGLNVYLFRRQVKDLKATHLRGAQSFPVMLRELVADGLVRINHSNNIIEFSNGSSISLNHIQYESDLDNFLSAEIHVALFDEASTFLPKMIRFIRSRVRLGSLQVPSWFKPFLLYATNPRGPAHMFFKSGFVDAAPDTTIFESSELEGAMRRIFIPAKLQDNPSLTVNDPGYIKRLKGLGDPDVIKAYLDGDWTVVEGAALPMFSRHHHIIKDRRVPRSWKIKRAYDYGYSAPYSVLFYCVATGETEFAVGDEDYFNPPKGSIIIVGEIYGDDGQEEGLKENVRVTARKILKYGVKIFNRHIMPGPADNAIFSAEQGPSISSMMGDEGVEWYNSNKSPGSRINGLAIVRQMLEHATVHPPEKPGLYIYERCTRLSFHLSNLQLDDKTGEDVDTKGQPEHDWDTLRYIALDEGNEITLEAIEGF